MYRVAWKCSIVHTTARDSFKEFGKGSAVADMNSC